MVNTGVARTFIPSSTSAMAAQHVNTLLALAITAQTPGYICPSAHDTPARVRPSLASGLSRWTDILRSGPHGPWILVPLPDALLAECRYHLGAGAGVNA